MKFIKNTILYITGILLICLYIYFRLIFKRTAKSLMFVSFKDTNINVNFGLIIFISFLFIISICCLIIFTKILLNKSIQIPTNVFTKFSKQVMLFLKESLLILNAFLAQKIPNSYEILKNLTLNFYKKYGSKEQLLILWLIVIPYSIIGITFLIDTFIFFKLNYFYKLLPIMLISLILNIWVFLITELTKNIDYIAEDFLIEHSFLPNGKDNFIFKIKPGLNENITKVNFKENIAEYLLLYPLKGFLESFEILESFYKIRSLLFMYLCYFISCTYILLINIQYLYEILLN